MESVNTDQYISRVISDHNTTNEDFFKYKVRFAIEFNNSALCCSCQEVDYYCSRLVDYL